MKTELPHYFVNEILFIIYFDAYNYCLVNKISIDKIIKSYEY